MKRKSWARSHRRPANLPAYPPAPHCNTRGLTNLGAHTVDDMMNKGMIVNPDHMSQRGVDATLNRLIVVEASVIAGGS